MEKTLNEMYEGAVRQLNQLEDGTELFGYFLGKAAAINEIRNIVSVE